MAKRPSTIKLGTKTIVVGHLPDYADPVLMGRFNAIDYDIGLKKGMRLDIERSVLFHELLHACVDHTGVRLLLNQDLEEKVVASLETALMSLLHDNPKLRRYLFDA